MTIRRAAIFLLLTSFIVLSPDANAQSRKGFEVGIGFGSFSLSSDQISDTKGGGVFGIAYGFSERFTLGVDGIGAEIDEPDADDGKATAGIGTLYGRLYFGSSSARTRGYALFGLGGGEYSYDDDGVTIKGSGPAGMLGAGLDHMFGNSFAIFGEVRFHGVKIDSISAGGLVIENGFDYDAGVTTVMVGARVRIR